jgi:hypothetical protein
MAMSRIGKCVSHPIQMDCGGRLQECEIAREDWPMPKADFRNYGDDCLPDPVELQVVVEHELEFFFDQSGHVTKVKCSCGREGTVEML